jgi:hypothetical protein
MGDEEIEGVKYEKICMTGIKCTDVDRIRLAQELVH